MNSRPPLWVRLNHLDKKTEFIHELKKENYSYSFSSKENVLEISGQKSVFLLESFKKGIFEIQDYASTEIVDTFTPYKGSYVWDACAGGGGKTIHIASKLMNKGVIYATDIREYKLGEIKNRAKKAQFFNIRTQVWDGIKLPVFGKEIQNHGGFDFILVDAPCSSSGTWRRNPDAKYRIEKKNINELSRLQIMLLNNASKMLHNKGTLIYATCSFFIEENEKIVEQFLQQNPEIKIINQKLLGNPEANSDTMFVAVFRK